MSPSRCCPQNGKSFVAAAGQLLQVQGAVAGGETDRKVEEEEGRGQPGEDDADLRFG